MHLLENQTSNGKSIRVLQVIDFINYNSGVSSMVMNYYKNLSHNKIQFDFLLFEEPQDELLKFLRDNNSRIFVSGQPCGRNMIPYKIYMKHFFSKYASQYDVVHVHIPNVAFVVLKYAHKYNVPVRIIHSHNSKGADNILKKIRNKILNWIGKFYANEFFACSKSAAIYLFGKCTYEQDRVEIIPNAIDTYRFIYDINIRYKMRTLIDVQDDDFVVGHVGRFVKQKNHSGLIDIFFELQKRIPKIKLILIGAGPLEDKIREKVYNLGLEEKVIYLKSINNIHEYMQAMDIFLLPSIYEGFPFVCVEAQSASIPCIVSDGVSKDIKLTDDVYFINNNDVNSWVEQAVRLKYDTKREIRYIKDYDIKHCVKKLEDMYTELWNKYKF